MIATTEYAALQVQLQRFRDKVPALLRLTKLTQDLAEDVDAALSITESPFTLAVAGQMRVGKSTLINAMIGADLAIPGVTETTATVNWFRYGTKEQSEQFRVVWNDASYSSDLVNLADKGHWSGNSELAARTRYLEFVSPAEFLKKVHVVDTPGTRSTIAEHEEKARGFLLSEGKAENDTFFYGGIADCIAYVLLPVTRHNDKELLGKYFAGSRLPQSTPYNSVGLLHKWEFLDHSTPWIEAATLATKSFQTLKSFVSEVIPVSGPLGRACQTCPPSFWGDVIALVNGTSCESLETLMIQESWFTREDPGCEISPEKRAQMRAVSQLVWPCFKVVLQLAKSQHIASGEELLAAVRKISGIDRLIEFMDRRFFDRSRLIRASTVLYRSLRVTDVARGRLKNRIQDLKADQTTGREALGEIGDNPNCLKSQSYISRHLAESCREATLLTNLLRNLEVEASSVRDSFKSFERDCQAMQYIDDHAGLFRPDESSEILRVLGAYGTSIAERLGADDSGNLEDQLKDLLDEWLALRPNATGERRFVIDQVVARIDSMLSQLINPDIDN